jgi:hypothetical protein
MKRMRYQEKQEGLNKDANKKDMIDPMENFEKIEEDMVTSFGKFGRCHAPEHMLCPQRFASHSKSVEYFKLS